MRKFDFENTTTNISGKEFLIIDLKAENISKIPLQLLYYKEHGYKNFLISYDFENLNMPYNIVLARIKIDYLFKMINEFNLKLWFVGFPRCIYEKYILSPDIRWYYEKNVYFYEKNDEFLRENIIGCCKCHFNEDCCGINKDYLKKFGKNEFSTLFSNTQLYNYNLANVEKFKSNEMKLIAKNILVDLKNAKHCMRKKFVFVKSYPDNLKDSSKERFLYYIYNRKDDFEKTFGLLQEYFDCDFLDSIKDFLILSNQIGISFGVMGDDSLRKTLYFTIDDLEVHNFEMLKKILNISFDYTDIWGIGIDFRDNEKTFKIYYNKKTVSARDMKDFLKDINLENKRSVLRFSNSLTKPLTDVFFDYKYSSNGELISRRIDISMQYNKFRFNQLALLFGINMGFFMDKELDTLSFELSNENCEKMNFYYTITPQRDEEIKGERE